MYSSDGFDIASKILVGLGSVTLVFGLVFMIFGILNGDFVKIFKYKNGIYFC